MRKEECMARRGDAENIRKFLDDLWKQAQQMLGQSRVKAVKIADAARIKMEIYLLDSKRGDIYRQLGESFYASAKRKKPSVRKQKKLISLMQELREIDGQEKSLRKSMTKKPKKGIRQGALRGRRRRRKAARIKASEKAPA
jgi:hypothetical protein